MPGNTLCSECGTELSSRELSRGLCPGCLLSLGLSLSELETGSHGQSAQDLIGTSTSRYLILEKIGQGGMGEVFLAQDTTLNRKVALKFLPGELQRSPSARQRFLREAKAAAALDHPYICKIHEIDEFEGRSFISMEYVPGRNLRQRLKEERLPLHDALKAAEELAEALGSAFQQGIVHRDLKPRMSCSVRMDMSRFSISDWPKGSFPAGKKVPKTHGSPTSRRAVPSWEHPPTCLLSSFRGKRSIIDQISSRWGSSFTRWSPGFTPF